MKKIKWTNSNQQNWKKVAKNQLFCYFPFELEGIKFSIQSNIKAICIVALKKTMHWMMNKVRTQASEWASVSHEFAHGDRQNK